MRIFKTLLVVLVILWGLLALVVRSTTPLIADYRDEIAGMVAQRLGVPVTIGALRARWYGLSPLLELHDVTLGSEPEVLRVSRVALDLAPLHLLTGTLQDGLRITIDGMQLTVLREPGGQIHLEGLGLLDTAGGTAATPPLPSYLRLVNTRVAWIDRRAGKPPVAIEQIAGVLERHGEQFNLRATLASGGGRAELSAIIDGLPTGTDWDGETYLKVSGLDVAGLFAPYLPDNYGVRGLRLDLESWSRWQDALPLNSQGTFAVRDLSLHPRAPGSQPLEVRRATASFSLQRGPGSMRLGFSDLNLALGDKPWPTTGLALAVTQQADGGRTLDLHAGYLDIAQLVNILQVRLPAPELAEPLARLQPRGEVRDLRFSSRIANDAIEWQAAAQLHAVDLQPWGDIPGVRNLDATLHGRHDHLVVELDSDATTIVFSELFRDPIALDTLNGRLDVLPRSDGWQVRSDLLVADSPHIRTRNRLFLDKRDDRPLFIDLQSDFRDGDAAFASRYYPAAIMGRQLVDWLDRSIVSGEVVSGSALVYGPVSEFAFEKSMSGIFQVYFDTRDIVLDYREGWPRVEKLAARVRFHGNHLDIESRDGQIYDSRITRVSAHIASLEPTSPLQVKGRLEGPLANNLRALREAALKPRFGRFAAAVEGDGDSVLDLDFTVPLDHLGDYTLDGRLRLDGNSLSLPEYELRLSRARGQIEFTLDGLRARGIRADALGAPVEIDVSSLDDGTTRVRTRGNIALDEVTSRFPMLPQQLGSGAADFVVDVDIPSAQAGRDRSTVLGVSSDLRGVAIDLPPPFGKTAAQDRRLQVRVPLGHEPNVGSAQYGGLLDARFSADGSAVDVALGGRGARAQPAPGIRVHGRLEALDTAAWQHALQPATGAASALPPVELALDIDRLTAASLPFGATRVHLQRRKTDWYGSIEAANVSGTFAVPGDLASAPLQVDLERLHIDLPQDADGPPADTAPPDPAQGPDPTALPALQVHVDDLRINTARLGQLELNAQRHPDGLDISRLTLHGGELTLESAGHWSRDADSYLTRLGGHLETDDIGGLLAGLGYSRQVEGASATVEFLLNWPGNPAQAHRATLAGKVTLDVDDGRLVELDPGVTRVVGLLNLNALTRRLRLDFRDLYKKGYSFDSIRGDFVFADGIASTDNLTVLGPSGRIGLAGSANLVARTLDQLVTVTPKYDATLPIAGTIAGGPVAGIAVLVAQQVMTDEVDNLNRFEYRLSGPWHEPDIRQLDSGGTLSKLLRPLSGTPSEPASEDAAQAHDQAPAAPPGQPAEQPADRSTRLAPSNAGPATAERQVADGPAVPAPREPSAGEQLRRGWDGLLRLLQDGGEQETPAETTR